MGEFLTAYDLWWLVWIVAGFAVITPVGIVLSRVSFKRRHPDWNCADERCTRVGLHQQCSGEACSLD